jgi:type IV pilus assembly protein PilO
LINNFLLRLAGLTMQKILIFSGVLGVLYYFMIFDDGSAIEANIAGVEQQIRDEENKAKEAESASKEFERVRASVGALSDQFKTVSQQIPSEVQMSEFIRAVDSVSRAAGVATRSKEPRQPINHDFYESIPLKIELDGSFSEVTMFLYYIASMERLMKVKNFVITTPTEAQLALRNGGRLSFSGEIISYRFLGDKASAEKGVRK